MKSLHKTSLRKQASDADIAVLDTQIEAHLAPFADTAARLTQIPGVGATAAAVLIAEIGVDMARFPTLAHLCSWAKFAPAVSRPGGRRQRDQARQPVPGPTPRQEEGHRPRRPLHPRHRLAPAQRPRHQVPRPRRRVAGIDLSDIRIDLAQRHLHERLTADTAEIVNRGVAPLLRSAGIPAPLLGDVDPTGAPDPSVDEQDLAGRPVVVQRRASDR